MRKDFSNMTPSIITTRRSNVGVVLACFVVAVLVAAGCGTATKSTATSHSDPLQVCFDAWNAATNATIRAALPANPVLADVQSLPTGSCSVGVYARQGGVLASWGFTADNGIFSPVETGMPNSGNAILTGREAASVSSSGLITRASQSALAALSAPGPVSGQAAACMLFWNGAKNQLGQQIAAAVASEGERAAVGLDTSSSDCLVVLGNTMFQTATIWQWSQGAQQQSLGDFFPQNSGQGVPFSQLDPSLTNWNASVHTDGCISPGPNVAAACPSIATPTAATTNPAAPSVASPPVASTSAQPSPSSDACASHAPAPQQNPNEFASNGRISVADRHGLRVAVTACNSNGDPGEAISGSVYFARYSGLDWAVATFAGDVGPTVFTRTTGTTTWHDDGMTLGQVCAVLDGVYNDGYVLPIRLSRLWRFHATGHGCFNIPAASASTSSGSRPTTSVDGTSSVYMPVTGGGACSQSSAFSFCFGIAPSAFVIGNTSRRAFHWQGWGQSTATGQGQVETNDCTPDCAAGRVTWVLEKTTLSDIGTCGGVTVYLRRNGGPALADSNCAY
jgi:hypothetical protein